MTRRRARNLADLNFEQLAERVAANFQITVGTSSSGTGTTITTDRNTHQIGDPNMFRVHDLNPPGFPIYEDGELSVDVYQSQIAVLNQRIQILEVRMAELSQLLVEHVKRTNPPIDRKKKRCIILDQEREVDEKTGV